MTPSTQFIAYEPEAIWSARKAFFDEGRETIHQVGDAVLRSWRRCNALGRSIHDQIEFAPVPLSELRMLADRNRSLLDVARPELSSLARSVAGAGYAVLLINARGQVVEVDGAISSHSTPLRHAFRRGVDLSEQSIGTSAMSLAISEQRPVSVCGPEHFFSEVQMFHCHAAPVFDSQGDIVGAVDVSHDMPGMLRSARWLANRCAQRIERRMFHEQPSFLHLQIDVDEGHATASSGYSQAWISLDPDGVMTAASRGARQLLGLSPQVIGLAFDSLFDCRFDAFVSRLRAGQTGGEPMVFCDGLRLRAWPTQLGSGAGVPASPRLHKRPESAPPDRLASVAHAQLPCYGDARIDLDFAQALRAFRADLPILLAGETGTGKDVTARALHQASAMSSGPFVALNCASIPCELLAGELFGHVDGAYTGSRRGGAPGKVEAAHGGTLFLDEIGDMPLQLQALLLRVLDSKEVVRLGDTQVRPVNIRVVCATHRDLRACVAQGRFREDLYYRVTGHEMTLLPLRERTDFDALLDTLLHAHGASPDRVSTDVRRALRSRAWPGNVRQLALTVRRALALADGNGTLELTDFGKEEVGTLGGPTPRTNQMHAVAHDEKLLQRAQHQAISQAMAATGGNVTAAATMLGMGRATLYRKIRSTASHLQ